jgi:hypothetical protein
MGFYRGSERLHGASPDLDPVITPHEYTVLLCRAMRTVLGTLGAPSDGGNAGAHRLLSTAGLEPGEVRAKLRHLKIALDRLLDDAASGGSLNQTLCAQLEIALLLVLLVPISARLGRPDLVWRVMTKMQLLR